MNKEMINIISIEKEIKKVKYPKNSLVIGEEKQLEVCIIKAKVEIPSLDLKMITELYRPTPITDEEIKGIIIDDIIIRMEGEPCN